jgi:NAD(P)-dependent dehydrogenase (short-subunit alcohol dehydrogenase family)
MQFQMLGIYAPYGATKSAIINYTKYLATELGPYNITVNCIAPASKDWLEALDNAVKV